MSFKAKLFALVWKAELVYHENEDVTECFTFHVTEHHSLTPSKLEFRLQRSFFKRSDNDEVMVFNDQEVSVDQFGNTMALTVDDVWIPLKLAVGRPITKEDF